MNNNRKNFQLIWGWALVIIGVAVFIRIPQVLPKIEQIKLYASTIPYIKFCLYILGILLVTGGSKKIFDHYKKEKR